MKGQPWKEQCAITFTIFATYHEPMKEDGESSGPLKKCP